MLSYPVILAVSAVGLVLTAIIVGLVSGSFIAALVVVALAGALVYIMLSFQNVSITQKEDGVNIDVDPIPAPNIPQNPPSMYAIKEVFHISGNNYTYDDAPAVCGAYGAELASYDQITEAQVQGAEWCGYGWSAAGMALYPTQQATWEALQRDPKERKRTACGHPGVNGGYFDPRLKFGVNCYGRKPPNMGTKLPRPLPGTDEAGFEKMVNKFKAMLTSMKLSPFNRDLWSKSGYGNTPAPPPTAKPMLDQPVEKSYYDQFTDLFRDSKDK
jgi:Extracellular link domain